MAAVDTRALGQLRGCKNKLSRQQYLTLRGQVLAGDAEGAMKGLRRILLLNGSNAMKNH
jgi:hypothetical protein